MWIRILLIQGTIYGNDLSMALGTFHRMIFLPFISAVARWCLRPSAGYFQESGLCYGNEFISYPNLELRVAGTMSSRSLTEIASAMSVAVFSVCGLIASLVLSLGLKILFNRPISSSNAYSASFDGADCFFFDSETHTVLPTPFASDCGCSERRGV